MDALLGPLIALARGSIARGGAAAGRFSLVALLGALAGVAATASIGCGLLALWTVMLPRVGPAWAALMLAGILGALCLGLVALMFVVLRREPRPPAPQIDAEASLLAAAQLFREHKGAMLLAALIAGLGVGAGGFGRSASRP